MPAAQSPVPAPFAATVLMTQVLVAAPLCDPFGTGRGGPKRHPAFEQVRNLQAPPGQSAFLQQGLLQIFPVPLVMHIREPPLQKTGVSLHATPRSRLCAPSTLKQFALSWPQAWQVVPPAQ